MHQTKLADERDAHREGVSTLVRVDIQTTGETTQAELDNVSQSGFLLWTETALNTGDEVVVFVDSERPGEGSIELRANVVRQTRRTAQHRPVGYGCVIIQVENA